MRPPADSERERSALEETYRRYAASRRHRRAWAASNTGNVAIRGELLDHVLEVAGTRLADGAHVLDVGCGGGWCLEALAARGVKERRLHGVDLLDERVDAARRRLPGADIRKLDAAALPLADRSIGLVLLLTVLSSTRRDTASGILAEVRRVLAPGGIALVYEPRVPTPLNRATRRIDEEELTGALGPPVARRTLTVAPPLARRLGRLAPRSYPVLARHSFLCTHRLWAFRAHPAVP